MKMNTSAKNIIRAIVLLALGIIAFIGIFSEPSENSTSWYLDFLASKGIGLLAIYTVSKLNERWSMMENQER